MPISLSCRRFLILGILEIGGWVICCWGVGKWPSCTLQDIWQCPYPLPPTPVTPSPHCDFQKCLETLSYVPWAGGNLPPTDNYCYRGTATIRSQASYIPGKCFSINIQDCSFRRVSQTPPPSLMKDMEYGKSKL